MTPNCCTRGKKCCVAGDTRILTPSGLARIDALRTGDDVCTILSDGTMTVVSVKAVHKDAPKELLGIRFSKGPELRVTGYHPILMVPSSFKRAAALRVGDEMAGIGVVRVVDRIRTCAPAPAYDLEIDGSVYIANGIAVASFGFEALSHSLSNES